MLTYFIKEIFLCSFHFLLQYKLLKLYSLIHSVTSIYVAIIQHLHYHLKQFISCHSSKTTNQESRSLLPAQTSSTILSSLWPLAAGSL